MSTLYIANTTKQDHHFIWRMREMQNPAMKMIKAGRQISIEDLGTDEIESIIRQHRRYGIQSAKELSRRRGFAGLSYSIDDPVDIDAMLATYEINDSALEKGAHERREVAAAATSEAIATELNKITGIDKERLRPKSLQMEVREETDGAPAVAEGIEVPADPKTSELRRARRATA